MCTSVRDRSGGCGCGCGGVHRRSEGVVLLAADVARHVDEAALAVAEAVVAALVAAAGTTKALPPRCTVRAAGRDVVDRGVWAGVSLRTLSCQWQCVVLGAGGRVLDGLCSREWGKACRRRSACCFVSAAHWL